MATARMEGFRDFLTERFTTVAVDIFAEVESMLVACYEENERLRRMLHMVVSPELKLPRIDVNRPAGAATGDGERVSLRSPPSTRLDPQITEPLPERPKEEQIECEISLGSKEKPQELQDTENATQACMKSEPDDEDVNMAELNEPIDDANEKLSLTTESSSTASGDEMTHDQCGWSSSGSSADTEERPNATQLQMKSTEPLQRTMLEFQRTMPNNSSALSPSDLQSFLTRITEGYRNFSNDEKPLITTMGLTTDVEMVSSAFGQVLKGSPLSYQCPVASSHNHTTQNNPPSRPPLPLCDHIMEPLSSLPVLSPEELDHVDEMLITWTEAHNLERSTCGSTELIDKLRKLRLTSCFRKICKLKLGEKPTQHLINKIRKGEVAKSEESIKAVALLEYCRRSRVNCSPCGLVVHPNAPWLGAVPDGVVYDPESVNKFGLVHIKETKESFSRCHFLVCRGGIIQLRKGHEHYWHIQGEMLVTGTAWCDLLVISKDDILVQRVYRDHDTIYTMKRKLDEFFFFHYLPSIVSSGYKTTTGLA